MPLFSHDEADENVVDDDDDDVNWVSGVSRLSLSEQNQAGLFYVCFNIPVSSSRQHSSSIEEALRGHDMMMMMIINHETRIRMDWRHPAITITWYWPSSLSRSLWTIYEITIVLCLLEEAQCGHWPWWWWSSLWLNIMIPMSTLVIKYEINRLHGMPTFWKVQGKANFGKMQKLS